MFEPTTIGGDEAVEESKGAARRFMAGRRNALDPHERKRLSAQLSTNAARLFDGCSVLAAYVSYASEPDMLPLIEAFQANGGRVLVPKLGPGLSRAWAWFVDAGDLAETAPGRPHEPSGPALGAEILAEADAVVVPALAVDSSGVRLGRGGGWYDRALAHRRPDVPVYAAVFDEQYLEDEELPHDVHDIPVTHVLTPSRVVEVGAARVAGSS